MHNWMYELIVLGIIVWVVVSFGSGVVSFRIIDSKRRLRHLTAGAVFASPLILIGAFVLCTGGGVSDLKLLIPKTLLAQALGYLLGPLNR